MSMEEILFFHKLNSAYTSFCVETLRRDGNDDTRGHEGKLLQVLFKRMDNVIQ